MKAIVYDGIQKVDCRKVADPKLEKDDDIIVKVTSTAICGSDLHLVHGLVKGMYDGFVLGHETMRIVEEIGMNIENEVFKKYKLKKDKLISYGFKKENEMYKYSKTFMNDTFKADICIDKNGGVSGRVIEIELDEEYTNFRMENSVGEFVNNVREEYIKILQDIANNCCDKEEFIFEQTNRITSLINEKYKVSPEFLWEKFPGIGVFRNSKSNKWFGIIMNIDKSKIIPEESGEIEVLNVKLEDVQNYLGVEGIYPSYHLSKKSWVTIILDDTLSDKGIMDLIDISYNLSNIKKGR